MVAVGGTVGRCGAGQSAERRSVGRITHAEGATAKSDTLYGRDAKRLQLARGDVRGAASLPRPCYPRLWVIFSIQFAKCGNVGRSLSRCYLFASINRTVQGANGSLAPLHLSSSFICLGRLALKPKRSDRASPSLPSDVEVSPNPVLRDGKKVLGARAFDVGVGRF
jgi:hypothetical protein